MGDSTPPVREKSRLHYNGLQKARVAPPSGQLISHVVPREKRVSGTHSSLIVLEIKTVPAREIEVKGKTEERSEKRRVADLLVLPRSCRMAQASAEKLEHTKPTEKDMLVLVPQSEQLASRPTPEPLSPKEKGTKPSEVGESQDERELHLGEREGDRNGIMGRKGWTPQ